MDNKTLEFSITIKCTLEQAWQAWTTEKGITGFFAPDCLIGSQPDDPYELYFLPENPQGSRGGEGNKILAVEPNKMFCFTWNAPPQFKQVRLHRTSVCIRFIEVDENNIRIDFFQTGWGSSSEWQQVYKYFQNAWGNIVLPRLKQYLEDSTTNC